MAIYLGRLLPDASSDLPGSIGRAALKRFPIWSCTGWGLPSPDVTIATGELLPHLFTLTLNSTTQFSGRYLFCCTFPRVAPGRCWRPPCPVVLGLSSGHVIPVAI